eukprot:15445032-Alexandrium_andersonii.AAC.1
MISLPRWAPPPWDPLPRSASGPSTGLLRRQIRHMRRMRRRMQPSRALGINCAAAPGAAQF